MDEYSYIANAGGSYIDELYRRYKENPATIDKSWSQFFEGYDFSLKKYGESGQDTDEKPGNVSEKEVRVHYLIHAYRTRGHLKSDTNPVRKRRDRKALLDLKDFGLGEEDLNTVFQAGKEIGIGAAPLSKIVEALKYIYEGTVGFEYMYVREPDVLAWLKQKIEYDALNFKPSVEEKKDILSNLNEAVVFENFLHTKYIGQKRFSLEGGETTIPALDALISRAADFGAEEVVMGMAHRGRLNVLANILGKTYENIFSEFEGTATPDMTMGDGDVKYHLGFSSVITTEKGKQVNLKLAPNPSHLEAVNPVVEGYVRAKADTLYDNDFKRIMPILIHGDSAVAGQGVVYEVIQMAKLEGYHTGGTIHFIINNQVGFTTDFDDARSSIYCSDVAGIIDAPVLHVNGDDPEAVVFCAKLAAEFRQTFMRDIFIDMVCYRRHGHNESDEPKFTQPELYNIIAKHPNPREIYSKQLTDRGDVDADLAKSMDKAFRSTLQDRLNLVKQKPLPYTYQKPEREWKKLRRSEPKDFDQSPDTGVNIKDIEKIGKSLIKLSEGLKPIKQITKLIKEREERFFNTKELNWAAAELLAYGSVLSENKIVRLSGQDSKRGTFSHRHAIIRDAETGQPYCQLDHITPKQEKLRIYNSFLSEFGAMGFEFGYAMADPSALTIWEAQFGDFANGAQVMIDQFISCSETKWQRMSGLVLLLPHGYEGQGPEHSNARPERFLQLAAEYNIIVSNVTTPANFFHLLRRQLAWPFRKPLIVMSPKSLLRHPQCVSPLEDFSKGCFKEVLDDTYVTAKSVKKVVLCSGKLFYEIDELRQKKKQKDVALIRIEQLYPFPEKQLADLIKKYKPEQITWAQEEPENMGSLAFLLRTIKNNPILKPLDTIRIVARKPAASPATGYLKVHLKEQADLIKEALK